MKSKAKYVKDIVIQDPDTGGDVDITIFKHENGGMFGIDASFLDQVATLDDQGHEIINDPFSDIIYDPLNPDHQMCPHIVLKTKHL